MQYWHSDMNVLSKNDCISFYPVDQFKPEPTSLASRLVKDSVCDCGNSLSLKSFMQNCQILLNFLTKLLGNGSDYPTVTPGFHWNLCRSMRPFASGILMFRWHCEGKACSGEAGSVGAWDLALSGIPVQCFWGFYTPTPEFRSLSTLDLSKGWEQPSFLPLASFKWSSLSPFPLLETLQKLFSEFEFLFKLEREFASCSFYLWRKDIQNPRLTSGIEGRGKCTGQNTN